MLLKEHKQIHKQPELMCHYANNNQEVMHKHKKSHYRLKNTKKYLHENASI